jgi:hypothetical protein
LLPEQALEENTVDKTIFICITLFIRLFTLSVIDKLIEKNKVSTISYSLLWYIIFYTLFLAFFTAIVNSDVYRMRIIFNYVNLHGNLGKLVVHVLSLWFISIPQERQKKI